MVARPRRRALSLARNGIQPINATPRIASGSRAVQLGWTTPLRHQCARVRVVKDQQVTAANVHDTAAAEPLLDRANENGWAPQRCSYRMNSGSSSLCVHRVVVARLNDQVERTISPLSEHPCSHISSHAFRQGCWFSTSCRHPIISSSSPAPVRDQRLVPAARRLQRRCTATTTAASATCPARDRR